MDVRMLRIHYNLRAAANYLNSLQRPGGTLGGRPPVGVSSPRRDLVFRRLCQLLRPNIFLAQPVAWFTAPVAAPIHPPPARFDAPPFFPSLGPK